MYLQLACIIIISAQPSFIQVDKTIFNFVVTIVYKPITSLLHW